MRHTFPLIEQSFKPNYVAIGYPSNLSGTLTALGDSSWTAHCDGEVRKTEEQSGTCLLEKGGTREAVMVCERGLQLMEKQAVTQ